VKGQGEIESASRGVREFRDPKCNCPCASQFSLTRFPSADERQGLAATTRAFAPKLAVGEPAASGKHRNLAQSVAWAARGRKWRLLSLV